ncbi:MAG: hypothetical protein Q8K05_08205, partial [Polaromonas sp.]|uniref:hypothetical protein n=1 Tax=Polaromonas sp. TaxID=1869339 RepID=UPI00272F142B
MKPLGQIISSAGLRSRLVLLVLIGLLPVSGLVVYTSLKNQQDGLVGARGALLVTARLAALSQAGTDLKIMAGDTLDASLPVALVVMDSRGTIIGTGGARAE